MVAPFALLFGAVATEAGLDLVQTMSMTVLVIAGAAQFAAVHLLAEGAPEFVAIFTGLAVNLRMAMYSASMAPHLEADADRVFPGRPNLCHLYPSIY